MDLDSLSDVIEDLSQPVVIGVAETHPGVGHETRLDRLRRRPDGWQVRIDQERLELLANAIEPAVAGDVSILIRPQGDQTRRETPRNRLLRVECKPASADWMRSHGARG